MKDDHALQVLLENTDYNAREYHGRGMPTTSTCLGVVIENGTLGDFISDVMSATMEMFSVGDADDMPEKVAEAFRSMCTDAMGKTGTIVYFTTVPFVDHRGDAGHAESHGFDNE